MFRFGITITGVLALSSAAIAQPLPRPRLYQTSRDYPETTGSINQNQNDTGGGEGDVTIPGGATGADTYQSNSAAGGNAQRPELAVPNGSAGGGGR